MAQQAYLENFNILTQRSSETADQYEALVQILDGLNSEESSDQIAALAARNIRTYIDLLRSSAIRPDDRNIHINVFQIIWRLSKIGGYKNEYRAGGLPELCLEFVKQERYRATVLEMIYHILDKSKLVDEFVELGVIDVLMKCSTIVGNDPIKLARPRVHVFQSLAIISGDRNYADILLNKGIADIVKKNCLGIQKEQPFEGELMDHLVNDVNTIYRHGLDILFNIAYLAEEPSSGNAYKSVLEKFDEGSIFDPVLQFCSHPSEQVAFSAFKIIWRLSSKLHENTSTTYRAKLISICRRQGISHPGHRRFCALTILTQMAKGGENLELIVNSGVFDMCATLGLEETGDMLGAVVKLLFVLSSTKFAALEQAGRSDCPRVLVKILKDAKYKVPFGKNWDRAITSQALLTLVNLALYGGNISNALLESGAVTVLQYLMNNKNVVGMVATFALGYMFGDDDSEVATTNIPRIDHDVFDVILETLENSLEGKICHGTIVWSVHEICLAFRCLVASKHNVDTVAATLPYLVKILDDFARDYGEVDEAAEEDVEGDLVGVETVENVLRTLITLSYTKAHMIQLIELGPSFEELLDKIACLLEDDGRITRIVDTLMYSLRNEKELTKLMESSGKLRRSGRIKWKLAGDASRLQTYLDDYF
mmetsp:Transcript_9135/g.10952  ORF Transcript_9135/g.10952 Transcript_9135/m.10952 type:complete len:653 (-) Transcript_9135:256-2214(-)